MAGHAPELRTSGERFFRWISNLSDLRISLYMLFVASLVLAINYVVNNFVWN